MRRLGDLHLCPPTGDSDQAREMIMEASKLGYSFVGVPLPPDAPRQRMRQLRGICSKVGIDLVTRVDLTVGTPRELLKRLRRLRRKFEIVSVVCALKSVARQAAKDRRVDLLSFPLDPRRRFFDSAEAELASGALAALEIDMAPLLSREGFSRIRIMSSLRREVEIARRFGVPVVVSSGATNRYQLRTPHDYAALTALFDLAPPLRLRALSENPWTIVERNREKLSSGYVAPGIRVVRMGRDCPGE